MARAFNTLIGRELLVGLVRGVHADDVGMYERAENAHLLHELLLDLRCQTRLQGDLGRHGGAGGSQCIHTREGT